MKTMLRSKQKSLIIVAIAAILLLAVGVSFCTWDNSGLKKLALGGNAAEYGNHYLLGSDVNGNAMADVGDTVYFGKYYQEANQTDKSLLEWFVADIRNENGKEVLYLVAKNILCAGNFYGSTHFYNESGVIVGSRIQSQCYNESTVRAWLNSIARDDGGTGFNTTTSERKSMNGLYNEAFNDNEKSAIIPRNLGSMKGYAKSVDNGDTFITYSPLTSEKLWIPSYTEIFGTNKIENGHGIFYVNDSPLDKQFKLYSTDTSSFNHGRTKFAAYNKSSFVNVNANYYLNNPDSNRWLLRTPSVMKGNIGLPAEVRKNEMVIMMLEDKLAGGGSHSTNIDLAVRPGVCIAR